MDFISNIIKRPRSILMSESTSPDAGANEAATTAASTTNTANSATANLIPLAMNHNISTELTELLDSATQDFERIEQQQHSRSTTPVALEPVAMPATPTSKHETIQQLLNEINLNLNQVSVKEMEHLQAMSAELSPLAVKPVKTLSMPTDQQKTLAALRQSLPGTPTQLPAAPQFELGSALNNYKVDAELDGGLCSAGLPNTKFTGLPEFDESKIPDLADLESKAQLCVEVGAGDAELLPALSSTSKLLEHEYNSDSDVFVECLSLNSEKFSADPAELETYRSALNDVVELSHSSDATLERSASDVASSGLHSSHNTSFEPMDVDEINATMELLKDVLGPEDHLMLQEHMLQEALQKSMEQKEPQQQSPQLQAVSPPDCMPTFEAVSPPIATHQTKAEFELDALRAVPLPPDVTATEADELQAQLSPSIPTQGSEVDASLDLNALKAIPLPDSLTPTKEVELAATAVELPIMSPPIPTHRAITEAELESVNAFLQPNVTDSKAGKELTASSLTLDMTTSIGSSTGRSSGPNSPTFPFKAVADKSMHFPRSPHAPPERKEMPYLEQALIESSTEHKLSTGGVLAKSPVAIKVTQSSPQKLEQELNETMAMFGSSQLSSPDAVPLLNGTFDAGPQYADVTLDSVPLSAATGNQRRTFSLADHADTLRRTFELTAAAEEHPRRTFSVHSSAAHSRRTFSMPAEVEQLDQVPSPPMEAAEQNIASEEFEEPMEVDLSLCVNAVVDTTPLSPLANLPQMQAHSPPILTHQPNRTVSIELAAAETPAVSPPLPSLLKRPSIDAGTTRESSPNATVVLDEQRLSAKEQATLSASSEKDDVYVETFGALSPVLEDMFKAPQYTSSTFSSMAKAAKPDAAASPAATNNEDEFFDAQFDGGNNNFILNSSDFDYLYTKGSNNEPVDRSSLLLKFDPLLGTPVPVNQYTQQPTPLLNLNNYNNNNNNLRTLSPTLEEHETSGSNQSFGIEIQQHQQLPSNSAKFIKPPVDRTKKHAKMSVDVIDNDCNKTFESSNLQNEDKANNYNNMDELEKKIKNEVTKSEDIEKKLKEAEQREEALIKRITEKDKTNAKLIGVVEAYEKTIAKLINEKEQLVQDYERQLQEVQTDRDSNYKHLMSLETTFSDLHVKYEKSKEMTSQLKQAEETLQTEKKQIMENLRLQGQRYEKMKSHAMQQLEIANKKLDTFTREHADEVTKLKALLKKEEVSRVSIAEQLQQKSRENADLVKICEELIFGKGQGGSS